MESNQTTAYHKSDFFKVACGYLLAWRLHFINRILGKYCKHQPISVIFGILNKECSSFTKPVFLGQTSSTIMRYKCYLKTTLFRKTQIFPLNKGGLSSKT